MRAAKIMKMISRTSNTSVNGVMLISAMTSSPPGFEEMTGTAAALRAGRRYRLVELGRNRSAAVVEVQHFGKLVGGDRHLFGRSLDPRLEVVEENDGDDGDEQTGGSRDQRLGNARGNDRR